MDILFPSLIAVTFKNPGAMELVKMEISAVALAAYLRRKLDEVSVPAALSPKMAALHWRFDCALRFPRHCWEEALAFYTAAATLK